VYTKQMCGLAIAAGMAGLLTLSVGAASSYASTQASAPHAISNNSGYGGGYRGGPYATDAICLAVAASINSPYIIDKKCEYLTYSPITGQSPDDGWYLWYFYENPNL